MKIVKSFKVALLLVFAMAFSVVGDRAAYAYNYSEDQQVVLDLMNDLRARNGARALMFDDTMTEAADLRAQEIVELFSHTRPDGSRCVTALDEYGVQYGTWGENIAYGTGVDGEKVYDMWDNSPPHHKNMVTKPYTRVGIGFYSDGDTNYWVQLFADGNASSSNSSNRSNRNNKRDYGSLASSDDDDDDDDEYYCPDCNVPLDRNLHCSSCGSDYELVDDDDDDSDCEDGSCY